MPETGHHKNHDIPDIQEIPTLSPRVKEYFALENAARSWWDTAGHPRYDRQLEFIRRQIPVRGSRVLDVATGRGRFAIQYARCGASKVVALDISPGMLEVARENARRSGEDGIEFVLGDIEEVAFEPGSFDLINCMEVYVHFPNPRTVTRRLFQSLRPGGLLVTNIDLPQTGRWYFQWLNEPLRTASHVGSGAGQRLKRSIYFNLLPRPARKALSRRFGWPIDPQRRTTTEPGLARLETTDATIAALQQDPQIKLSRAEDAIHRWQLTPFVEMLRSEGFRITRQVREGLPHQLAYGYIVVAEKPEHGGQAS